MTEHYDVIIVGTGAGGGTLAHVLGNAGRKILLLERGDFLPRQKANWDPQQVFANGRYVSRDTWYDAQGRSFQPQAHYFVGGATKMYGAALYRLRPGDFGAVEHEDGISPAWPLTYDDMEPYYTRAEHLYQVHGEHGEDPTEGHWSKQYPHPPVSHEPRIAQLAHDLKRAGYRPFHAPCGVLLNEAQPEHSTCIRCNTCDGFPCMAGAKSDAEVIAIRPVMDLPNVTLVTNAQVTELESDRAFTVTGVRTADGRRFTGDIVALAAGAANTAAILLRSGLANSSDQVGRNYMFHNSTAVLAIDREPNDTVFQKTLGLNDFYWPLGNIQMVGKSSAAAMRAEAPRLARLVPDWSLAKIARHAVDFWLTTEDLPLPGNRVMLERDGHIKLSYSPTNTSEARQLYAELRTIMNHIGIAAHHVVNRNSFLHKDIPLAGVAHQAGTCRFGTDRATSVLDVNCRAHDLDNLYVTDASFFPSIGAVNPALTIMANAIRVGEHLLERLDG